MELLCPEEKIINHLNYQLMKKNIILSLIAMLICGIFVISCSKNSEDTLPDPNDPNNPGNPQCDTTNRKYAADVVPILQANCYGCHGSSTNTGSGGIVLDGYDNLKAKASSGVLIGVLTHAAGFPQMPKDAAKLSDCNINTIRSWINNGIQNN